MSDKTKIEWTDATWNPIRARNRATGRIGHFCVHVSEGCRNCYAERVQPRFGNPIRYAAQDRDKVELFLDDKVLMAPLEWRKPRRVFVCSMTDLFFEDYPDEWIDGVFAVMALCPQHTFQVLTKRSEWMRRYMTDVRTARRIYEIVCDLAVDGGSDVVLIAPGVDQNCAPEGMRAHLDAFPLPNVHLGVSVEDQARADERIPILLDTPAAVRFISAEPLLGPVDLTRVRVADDDSDYDTLRGSYGRTLRAVAAKLDWVIVGGESGRNARPVDVEWMRSIIEQCKAAKVPCFVKQDSGPRAGMRGRLDDDIWLVKEWPADLRVREFPA